MRFCISTWKNESCYDSLKKEICRFFSHLQISRVAYWHCVNAIFGVNIAVYELRRWYFCYFRWRCGRDFWNSLVFPIFVNVFSPDEFVLLLLLQACHCFSYSLLVSLWFCRDALNKRGEVCKRGISDGHWLIIFGISIARLKIFFLLIMALSWFPFDIDWYWLITDWISIDVDSVSVSLSVRQIRGLWRCDIRSGRPFTKYISIFHLSVSQWWVHNHLSSMAKIIKLYRLYWNIHWNIHPIRCMWTFIHHTSHAWAGEHRHKLGAMFRLISGASLVRTSYPYHILKFTPRVRLGGE